MTGRAGKIFISNGGAAGRLFPRQAAPRVFSEPAKMNTAIPAAARRDFFPPLATAYLVVPNLVFLAFWLRLWIGIPAAVITAACLFRLLREGRAAVRPVLPVKTLLLVLALAFAWTLLGGAGGFVPQGDDYKKHNLLFHDLQHLPWPVHYSLPGGGTNYLCYGLGYYLVPALGGRVLGEGAVPGLTFLWAFAGVALFFWWLATLAGGSRRALWFVLLLGATGLFWKLARTCGVPGLIGTDGLEGKLKALGLFIVCPDSFTRFRYQPQHALAGWLGAAVLFEMLWRKKNSAGALFVWAAVVGWSPLTAAGLLLLPLAAWKHVPLRGWFEPVNLLGGGLLLAILGIYIQGHVALADSGPVWKWSAGVEWLPLYFLFLASEFSPLLFLWLADRKFNVLGEWRPLFLASALVLVLLPLWKIGFNSDLRLEASGPALLLVTLAAARCFEQGVFTWKQWRFALLAGALLAAAASTLARASRFREDSCDLSYPVLVEKSGFHTLPELKVEQFDAASQYLGREDSFAARWLLR